MPEHIEPLRADPEWLTRLWNRGYEGYLIPLSFSEGQMRAHLATNDIAVEDSVGLFADGDPVGFSLLGVRGSQGWIGGFGIVPEYRGRGLSHRLLTEQLARARALSLRRVRLEVLAGNPAGRVYAAAGFQPVRRLSAFSGRLPREGASAARPMDPRLLTERLDPARGGHAPVWQREVACWRTRGDLRGIAVGAESAPSGYAVFPEPGGGRIGILDAAALGEETAAEVLRGLAEIQPEGAFSLVNEPVGSPLHRALLASGCTEIAVQVEMEWHPGAPLTDPAADR